MSIDPSAIPSFGPSRRPGESGQPTDSSGAAQQGQGQGQARRPAGPIMPDKNLVKQLLDRMKLKHTEDKQGDVVVPWKHFRTYVMFRGEERQRVMSVRTFYDRPHTLDDKPRLLETADEWNRRTLWPKVYTHTNDEGTVRLIGEVQMMIGQGVVLDHFISSLVSWVRAAIEFDKWLVEQLGLAKDAEDVADGRAAGGDGKDGKDAKDS